MFKKIATFLFLVVYLMVSSFSFAQEVVLEVLSPVVEESVAPEIVPEIEPTPSISEPVVDVLPATESETIPAPVGETLEPLIPVVAPEPVGEDISDETSTEVGDENLVQPVLEDSVTDILLDELDAAPQQTLESEWLIEIPPTTEPVMVEENSIFTPPGPEPEPWQPAARPDPTTDNVPIWNTETQSDPQFLAENSVFVRRMAESVIVDRTAKHSCRVDIFRTDISETTTSILSVRFYGTSLLASYDAEIGSLPNGIDVRFEKNNDYLYDFRGKETTLELIVNKQDSSLSWDFTIPIIYTAKGKKESSVICQLNIINETEEVIQSPIVPVVEPEIDMAQELVEIILEDTMPEPAEDIPPTPTVAEILEVVLPETPPPPTDPIPEIIPVNPTEDVLVQIPEETPQQIPDTPLPETVIPENDTPLPLPIEPIVDIPTVEVSPPEASPEISVPEIIPEPTPSISPDASST